MADDTFSSIAEGYGGAQKNLQNLGLLPGSFQPMDPGGTAMQVPTMAAPQFTTTVSHTIPFPAQAQFAVGATAPPPPMPPGGYGGQFGSTGMPRAVPNAPQATIAISPPPPQLPYSGGMASSGVPYGMPSMAPAWTNTFTNPPRGQMAPPAPLSPGTFVGDALLSQGYFPMGPVTGQDPVRAQAAASRRMGDRFEGAAMTGLQVASVATGIAGGAAAIGIGGGLAAGLGAVAAPIFAGAEVARQYYKQREQILGVEQTFGGIRGGSAVSGLGQGISPTAAKDVFRGLRASAGQMGMRTEDLTGIGAMAQEMGMMKGHTQSTSEIVARIKAIAQVTKDIRNLGEEITAMDAMELTQISQQMGIGLTGVKGIGKRIVTAARVAGVGLPDAAAAAQMGAGMYAGAGLGAGAGMQAGATAMTSAYSLANRGVLSAREMSRFGGQQGLQQNLLEAQASFSARFAQPMILGALGSGFGIDEGRLQELATGATSLEEGQKRGIGVIKGKGLTKRQRSLRAQFVDEHGADFIADIQEKLGPDRVQQMLINQAVAYMDSQPKDKPISMHNALRHLTGGDENRARAVMKIIENPEIVADRVKEKSKMWRENLRRRGDAYEYSERGISGFLNRHVIRPLGEFSESVQSAWSDPMNDWRTKQDQMAINAATGAPVSRPWAGAQAISDERMRNDFSGVLDELTSGGGRALARGGVDNSGIGERFVTMGIYDNPVAEEALGDLGVDTRGFFGRAIGDYAGGFDIYGLDSGMTSVAGEAARLRKQADPFIGVAGAAQEFRKFESGEGANDYLRGVAGNISGMEGKRAPKNYKTVLQVGLRDMSNALTKALESDEGFALMTPEALMREGERSIDASSMPQAWKVRAKDKLGQERDAIVGAMYAQRKDGEKEKIGLLLDKSAILGDAFAFGEVSAEGRTRSQFQERMEAKSTRGWFQSVSDELGLGTAEETTDMMEQLAEVGITGQADIEAVLTYATSTSGQRANLAMQGSPAMDKAISFFNQKGTQGKKGGAAIASTLLEKGAKVADEGRSFKAVIKDVSKDASGWGEDASKWSAISKQAGMLEEMGLLDANIPAQRQQAALEELKGKLDTTQIAKYFSTGKGATGDVAPTGAEFLGHITGKRINAPASGGEGDRLLQRALAEGISGDAESARGYIMEYIGKESAARREAGGGAETSDIAGIAQILEAQQRMTKQLAEAFPKLASAMRSNTSVVGTVHLKLQETILAFDGARKAMDASAKRLHKH